MMLNHHHGVPSSSLWRRRRRCWWYLPWTHLEGDAQVVIIAPAQRRHGDRTVLPVTWADVSGGSLSLLIIQPCCLFFNPQLSHHLQRPLPSSAVQMSLSPSKNESINLSCYPSFLSPLVFVFQAIIFPRSSLIWSQSLSVSSEAGEPKRNPDSFEATIVCLLKAVYIPKCCGSKSDFQADWIEGTF